MSKLLYTFLALLRAGLNIGITLFVGAYFSPASSSVFLLFRRDHTMWSNCLHMGLPYYQFFDTEEGGEPHRVTQTLFISLGVAALGLFVIRMVFSGRPLPDYALMLTLASIAGSVSFALNSYFVIQKDIGQRAIFETVIQIGPYLLGVVGFLIYGIETALCWYVLFLLACLAGYLYRTGCLSIRSIRQALSSWDKRFIKGLARYGLPRMIGGFSEVAILTVGLHELDDPKKIAAWTILTTVVRAVPILFQPIAYLHGTNASAIHNLRVFIGIIIAGGVAVSIGFAAFIHFGGAALFFPKLDFRLDPQMNMLLLLAPGLILLYSIKDMLDYKKSAPINASIFTACLAAGWMLHFMWPGAPLHIIYFAGANVMAALNLWFVTKLSAEERHHYEERAMDVDDQYI